MIEPPSAQSDPESYQLLEILTPNRTFLCSDISGNIVVLKRLEDDCLHRSSLHPGIRDRLARLRDLPHPGMATLRTAERWNGTVCLVWTYLDGQTWNEAITYQPGRIPQFTSALARTVDALHDLGIVHGNLHSGNIIVRPDRQVWVTDFSPYLYVDPAADESAITDLLKSTVGRLKTAQARSILALLESNPRLKELSQAILKIDELDPADSDPPIVQSRSNIRAKSLWIAIFLTLAATVTGLVLHARLSAAAHRQSVQFKPVILTHSND